MVSLNPEDVEKIARMVAVGAAATIEGAFVQPGTYTTTVSDHELLRRARTIENYILRGEGA